jgi:urate oxidase/2-oxo-4-hydroxy-4-carboxy-5-ureidoimidazoline decarboxylase
LEQFSSGWKRNYYGKGDVIVYRLQREGTVVPGQSPIFGASVKMLLYGDAFWRTYTEGDNTGLVATDSMKNFIQRETLRFSGGDLESYCRFLAEEFLQTYPQTEGIQVSAEEIPYTGLMEGGMALTPTGPEKTAARIEMRRMGEGLEFVEVRSGIRGFRLVRLGGSAFQGFVRDQYTTLPEIANRPLHMWLDLEWFYTAPAAGFTSGQVGARVRSLVYEVFQSFESGSIQQVIYQLGTRILAEVPCIASVDLEANNRTWDTVVEEGERRGVYTDPRPPYGCLGLSLRRESSD